MPYSPPFFREPRTPALYSRPNAINNSVRSLFRRRHTHLFAQEEGHELLENLVWFEKERGGGVKKEPDDR